MTEEFKSLLMEVFSICKDPEDVLLRDLFDRFPAFDVQGVHEKSINQEILIPYLEKIITIKKKEEKIQFFFHKVLIELNRLEKDSEIKTKAKNTILFGLWSANELIRRKFGSKPHKFSPEGGILLVEEKYPHVNELFYGDLTEKAIIRAIGEVQLKINQSVHRFDNARRKELRDGLTRNYDWLFALYVDNNFETMELHKSRLDRIVIDVYSTRHFTWQKDVKQKVNENSHIIKKELNKNRLPSVEFIKSLEAATFTDKKTIDELIKELNNERERGLKIGFWQKGKIIQKIPTGTVEFTFDPYKIGAPIRLRLITNVQNEIKKQLWTEKPWKKEQYEKHAWSKGSETNFIMPEDYDYYYAHESTTCHLLEEEAKNLFTDMMEEHLKQKVNPEDMVVVTSQWEVCYEEPFYQKYDGYLDDDKVFIRNELFDYLKMKFDIMHPFANDYAGLKWEPQTSRHSFYCDIPSMDPTLPLMQYKIYPKFRNMEGNVMLRHEFIPSRFSKIATADSPDGIPLGFKVLSNPEYCREMMELYFQFEMVNNGMEGNGYNERYRKWSNLKKTRTSRNWD